MQHAGLRDAAISEETSMTTLIAHRHWLRFATCGIVLAAAIVAPAWAQDAPAETDDGTVTLDNGAAITPAAQAVLNRMTATLNSQKRYAVTAHITRDEVLPFGYKLQHNEVARMWVESPNRLRLEVEGDIKNRTFVYDGAQLASSHPITTSTPSTAAPNTLGELVRVLLDAEVEMPLIDMLYQGNAGNLTEDVRVGIVVGDSQVDGVATDHLAFRQPDVDWQLWVEKGAQALPRKLLITTRYEVGDPQYQAILKWDMKPAIDANSFVFVPPAGATKIRSPHQTGRRRRWQMSIQHESGNAYSAARVSARTGLLAAACLLAAAAMAIPEDAFARGGRGGGGGGRGGGGMARSSVSGASRGGMSSGNRGGNRASSGNRAIPEIAAAIAVDSGDRGGNRVNTGDRTTNINSRRGTSMSTADTADTATAALSRCGRHCGGGRGRSCGRIWNHVFRGAVRVPDRAYVCHAVLPLRRCVLPTADGRRRGRLHGGRPLG